MAELVFKTKGNASPKDKPKVYFTCHPDDFDRYFKRICEDIFKTYDCAIFYTEDMTAQLDDKNRDLDLYSMNLFVMPITFRLLTEPNRAMDEDYAFADEKHIPVLPLMMETSIDEFYSRRFGERQYIYVYENDPSKRSYPEQLENYLNTVFLNKETVERIRKAFDAYIFLSYRKKDRRYANELMKMIHSHPEFEKLAIWYDEFLTPGESFMENIQKILSDSQLFTLLVTPNLLEKPNFVMEHEYPAAHDSGKPILPAQMVGTDPEQLKADYTDIPNAIDVQDEVVFDSQFLEVLRRYVVTESHVDPEHNYLIGLAYLDGIDVEVDKGRGVQMITAAAEADLPEAMEKLRDMYFNGHHVRMNYIETLKWSIRIYELYYKEFGERNETTLLSLNLLAIAYGYAGKSSIALNLLKKCYLLRCEVSGEMDSETLMVLANLSVAYGMTNQHQKSLELSEKCYKAYIEMYGEAHYGTICALQNLSRAYYNVHNYKIAFELTNKCYLLQCETLGTSHPDTLGSKYNTAIAYLRLKNYQKAIDILKSHYNLCCLTLGKTHHTTLLTLFGLASAYYETERYTVALSFQEKCYRIMKATYGEFHPETLGSLYFRMKILQALNYQQKLKQICNYVIKNKQINDKRILKTVYSTLKKQGKSRKKAQEIKHRLDALKSNKEEKKIQD